MTPTITLHNTHQFHKGTIVTLHDGTVHRITSVDSAFSFTIIPLSPLRRLWRFLTTAPNGDATRWMVGS